MEETRTMIPIPKSTHIYC